MSNIKIYDWTSDTGELERRTIIYEDFEKNGKKYCHAMGQIDTKTFKREEITAQYDKDRLISVPREILETSKEKEEDYRLLPLPDEIVEKIKKEQKGNLKKLNDMLDEKLDLEKVYEIIDKVDIKEKIDKDEEKVETVGFYDGKENCIALKTENVLGDDFDSKTVRLHEFIHLIQNTLDDRFSIKCLNEPQVESLAQEFMMKEFGNEKKAKVYCNEEKKNGKKMLIKLYYENSLHYFQLVNFLKQMEFLLGRKFYQKNLLDRQGFYRDFANKYGEPLLTYLGGRFNRIDNKTFDDLDEYAQYINETQDVLFKEVFDRDISMMGSMEGAIKILDKMKGIANFRQQLYVFSPNESNIYNNYQQLYEEYYKKIGRKLAYMGHSKCEIVETLGRYKYINYDKERCFDTLGELIENVILQYIKKYEEYEKTKFDPQKVGIQYILGKYDEVIFRVYEKENNKAKGFHVKPSAYTKIRNDMNIEDDYTMVNLVKTNFKELIDAGKEFEDIDVEKYIERKAKQEER